jgi:HEAT repeat protein
VCDAANALIRIDRPAAVRSAVPALTRLLTDGFEPDWRAEAMDLLGELGPDARPSAHAICEDLTAGGARVRLSAARALARIKPGGNCCGELLGVARADVKGEVRAAAAEALWHCGMRRPAVAILTEWLRDESQGRRWEAAQALGRIGPAARDALPALRALCRQNRDYLGVMSAAAVWRIATPVESGGVVFDPRQDALATLLDIAKDRDAPGFLDALEVLGEIGPEARAAVPVLTWLLTAPKPHIPCYAAGALGSIGPDAAAAAPALAALLRHEDRDVRGIAAVTLFRIGRPQAGRPVLAHIAEQSPWWFLRYHHPTEPIVPEAAVAVPFLLRELRHDDRYRYLVAAAVLRRIDPKAADRAGVP